MRFQLPDDTVVVGNSYADIVRQMNDQKLTPAKRQATYRRALASRVKQMYGQDIDDTSDKALIKSLERVGLIARV